jgi:subtilase family serine protease
LPAAIEDRISGVIFPQPRHRAQVTVPPGLFQTSGGDLRLTPQIVAQAYGVSGLGLDGTGQTIVVLGGSTVNPADLTAFWSNCGLPTTASQFTEIDPFPQFTHPNADASEETKDIEWSSAMAPKARILYVSSIAPETLLSVLMPLLPTDSTICANYQIMGIR